MIKYRDASELRGSRESWGSILRPLERSGNNGNGLDQVAFRVHFDAAQLKNLGLAPGDLITISNAEGFRGYGIAWLAQQANGGNKPIVKTADVLRELYDLNLTDTVFMGKANVAHKPLKSIEITFAQRSESLSKYGSTRDLEYCVGKALDEMDIILPGCTFDVHIKDPKNRNRGSKLRATVKNIEPVPDESSNVHFDHSETQILVTNELMPEEVTNFLGVNLIVNGDGIGGLSDHLRTINRRLELMIHPALPHLNPHLKAPTTFLVHGSEGCGKTLLLKRMSECQWRKVFRLDINWLASNRKAQSEAMIELFGNARKHQPSLILMDDLDKFLQKGENFAGILHQELEKLVHTRVAVAAAARSVYDIDASLRVPTVFRTELEIFPPNVRQREDMLRKILGPDQKLDFVALAERSHGFVGRDLHKLCVLATGHREDQADRAMRRGTSSSSRVSRKSFGSMDFVLQADFEAVFDQVQPTVLKDSILEVPKVRWTDIAGVDSVRAELEAITVRPYKYPDLYSKFGTRQSRKGVLLYGPPGCAKTLIAQAVATESNQNFLAVKGSELIKMYVGESERAIRDVFRRARAAKPCIIFFDEIDSIGKSREKSQDSGLNVVTTLLNEMDGIEALKDVFIIGATNRPDILDSALIRKGRFDAHIHIGLPNEVARRQIIEIHTREQPLAKDVDLHVLASLTEGSSGADIKGLCDVAVDLARADYMEAPDSEPQLRMCHFQWALEKHVPHTDRAAAARYEGWRPGRSLSVV